MDSGRYIAAENEADLLLLIRRRVCVQVLTPLGEQDVQ